MLGFCIGLYFKSDLKYDRLFQRGDVALSKMLVVEWFFLTIIVSGKKVTYFDAHYNTKIKY